MSHYVSKNKKQLTQEDIKKINLAKKIQSNLPSDLIENDKENKANQSSNRYKIERTVEEDSDFNINNNIINNPKFINLVLYYDIKFYYYVGYSSNSLNKTRY